MRSNALAFIIILIIPGELYAEEKPCGLPNVENGRIAPYYYTFESFYFPMSIDQKLSFSCLAGYTTETGKQEDKTTCTRTGWNPGLRCFKKCTKPDLMNGVIADVKLLYKIQETMRYSCASGYKTTGGQDEEVVQCLADGWSSQPACRKEYETCLAPELYHGNYSTTQRTFNVKGKVRYECAPGYYTAGGQKTEEVECHTYGWTVTPKCTKLKCSSLRLIENGYFHPVKQTYEEGDVVQFFCHENYYLSGADLIQCYNFGWYPESPVCEGRRNRCPPPPLPLNSKIQTYSTTYRHGETVRIECELNFEIQGPEEIRCDNGKWTDPPKCTESKGMCASPPLITNGVIIGSAGGTYENGSSVEYRCFDHHFLQGPRVSHCLQGVWTTPPLCLEPCTLSPVEMEKNNLLLKWDFDNRPYIFHGEYIEFLCRRGTSIARLSTVGSELRRTLRCETTVIALEVKAKFAQMTGRPVESKGMCASPPLITNGVIIGSAGGTYENGSSVEYRCFDHHFLQGPRVSHCLQGVWTTPPLCLGTNDCL
ncbi:PREDICTED: coagulation factor XIII B chain [Hipposideros armiger]|uniref:Coagulation factor XIII B chain n=1 Tax=Hipposideros armiger TaxID=186990 RepID=A0A8B7QXJ8_HIPAR|nr:PREDICTED: coagulation factor XIII B chain [Hipposideros armiger]